MITISTRNTPLVATFISQRFVGSQLIPKSSGCVFLIYPSLRRYRIPSFPQISSSQTPVNITLPRIGILRSFNTIPAKKELKVPLFMSTVPRPYSLPSSISPSNGWCSHSDSSCAGITSKWPLKVHVGPSSTPR